MTRIIEIDGSYLEGGGQILRNALSLSCLIRRPVRIINIRANRPNPGLNNQHLYGVNILRDITGGHVRGNFIKSKEVEFHPGPIRSGSYTIDTQTAASISLVLQAAIPVLLFGQSVSKLEVIGGTNVAMAPQVDYMTEVFRPNLELFGASFDFDLLQRGYYPKGGGRCVVTVPPIECLKPVDITSFGNVTEVCGWCFVAGRLPLKLAEEMKLNVDRELSKVCSNINVEAYQEKPEIAKYNASGIILKAVTSEGCTVGAGILGDHKIPIETRALNVTSELLECINKRTCVDMHVQDQLILFMALAAGKSRIHTCPLTNHAKTAIYVAEIMTEAKFHIENIDKDHVIIECEGIGMYNKNYKN